MRRGCCFGIELTRVELALLAGRSLEQIERDVIAGCAPDEESVAPVWLPPRSQGPGPERGFTHRDGALTVKRIPVTVRAGRPPRRPHQALGHD
jgi:hypothetical protein